MDTHTEHSAAPVPAPVAVVRGAEGNSPVYIGRGLLSRAGEIAAGAVRGRRALVVADTNVGPLHLAPLLASLGAAGFAAEGTASGAGVVSAAAKGDGVPKLRGSSGSWVVR